MEILWIIVAVLAAISTALLIAWLSSRGEAVRSRENIAKSEEALHLEREARARAEQELAAERAAAKAEIAALKARNEEVQSEERKRREEEIAHLKSHFRNLSTEILGEQSKQFRETNRESLDVLLKPFQDNIKEFRERVERIYSHENEQRGELKNELKHLLELNHRITTETTNLTNALRGNSKIQGDWGETLLETILDSSSLTKGLHYTTQHNLKDSEGKNLRPDVILHLPEGRSIVIDSKVSLTAYVAYTAAESHEERQRHLTAHLSSVRQHVTELGRKEYQRLLDSPDFVIMFIPTEPAFLEAMKSDPSIWNDAYQHKVIISSPTNLFALLKMVADLWKYDAQEKSTQKIAELGLKLYEKAVLFTESLEEIGSSIQKAQKAYDQAQIRLSGKGSLVSFGEQLKKTAHLQSKKSFSPALQAENEE